MAGGDMTGNKVFRFSIGPVQGFIAQARRTRDLWAGSFLLSWLAAHAMVEVRRQKFEIVFPNVENDALIKAIERRGDEAPALATVPNQFMARGAGEFDPQAVEEAVRVAWRRVAKEVYDTFIGEVATSLGKDTRKVYWERQVDHFWEMYWVLGPEQVGGEEGAWLAARKNWRSHRMPDQGGERCTLMGEWQEISGFGRFGERQRRDAFWQGLQRGDRLDLRDGERLCAMALVKRLFPRLPDDGLARAVDWIPGRDPAATRAWPSTGHVAAARWLADIARHPEVVAACDALADYVRQTLSDRHFGEQRPRIRCVREAAGRFAGGARGFPALDAGFLRLDDILNARSLALFGLGGTPLDEDARLDAAFKMAPERSKIVELHRNIRREIERVNEAAKCDDDRIKFDEPPPYYALLLMDGDKVGKLLGCGQDNRVSLALSDFTDAVSRRFGMTGKPADIDGVAIYAGGDDVLALTTVEQAIPAAAMLAKDYRAAFDKHGVKTPSSEIPDISAAIVFADHHEPFRDVVQEAHRLLDRVAKEKNGRASLAIGVQKPSGQAAEWVGKWRSPDGAEPPEMVLRLARERAYSNRFPYNLRARYIAPAMGKFDRIGFTNGELEQIFRHELGRSRGAESGRGPDTAEMGAMLAVSRPPGASSHDTAEDAPSAGLDEGGLLVVRFLDQCGIWGHE